jgi:ribosomal protein L22
MSTPEDPKPGTPEGEPTEVEATEETGIPQAEGTAADVTGVGKDAAAAALQEGSSEPLAAGADDDPAVEDEADEPVAEDDVDAPEEETEVAAAAAETESDLAKTDEPDPDAADADDEAAAGAPATAGRRRGRRGRRGRGAGAEEPATPAAAPARRAPARREGELVLVRAQAKYVRTSARKARLVCDHIRGKSVQEARAILAHTPRAVARDWSKLLESAIANAEHNHELIGDDLRVFAVTADEGPTLKRFRPRAMGRATRIRKRTSHLTITLTPKE